MRDHLLFRIWKVEPLRTYPTRRCWSAKPPRGAADGIRTRHPHLGKCDIACLTRLPQSQQCP